MASEKKELPQRERRPSVGAPIVDIQGSVGPAGISRPKHKRTLTGFGASEIKTVEGEFWPFFFLVCFAVVPLSSGDRSDGGVWRGAPVPVPGWSKRGEAPLSSPTCPLGRLQIAPHHQKVVRGGDITIHSLSHTHADQHAHPHRSTRTPTQINMHTHINSQLI